MVATATIAVLVVSVLIGLGAWGVGKHAERTEKDPKYRRRSYYMCGVIYLFLDIVMVAIWVSDRNLVGLINVPFLVVGTWACFRGASKIVIPPDQKPH
jgi:hypothetical protein